MCNSPAMRPAAGLHIVAVEDETLIALDLHDMLMAAGTTEVLIARDVASLADILKRGSHDIAIVNVEPAHGGVAKTARLLRDAGSHRETRNGTASFCAK